MKNNKAKKSNEAPELKTARTDALLPISSKNLQTLIAQKNITQQYLHELTGVAESTISNYKTGKSFPTIDFLLALKKEYGISIDDFITRSINPVELTAKTPSSELEREEQLSYQKFCGTYFTYYFDTSKYKGRDFNTAEESLMYGILHIYETPSSVNSLDYSCFAILGIHDLATASDLKQTIESLKCIEDLEEFVNSNDTGNSYYGDFELTHDHAFLSLTHGNKDKALIIFHRPHSNKSKHKSGIGTINSVSRGRESMPVVQFIGISRDRAELSCEEIHRNLLLNYPSFKAKKEADELIRLVKHLYVDNNDDYGTFTELQKRLAIQASLESFIRKSLESNMFRYGKISNRDDDDWYHALKESAAFSASNNLKY